jgi:hypothetical protein
MGSVDEPGAAAEPVKSEAHSQSQTAPEIRVERDEPPHRDLDDGKAPILFVPAARQRFSRAAIIAIAIALSAAAGSAVGAAAAFALAKPEPVSSGDARTMEVNALRGVIAQLSSEVASLKASIESSTKSTNAQMARIAERVDRAEKAQAEPAQRVAKLSEMLERLDKRTATAVQAQLQAPAAAPDITGSISAKPQDRGSVVSGWVLREVFRGGAMVENDRMGLFEVVPGANLPGLGRVESIRRQDGRWVVVTPKGLIGTQR